MEEFSCALPSSAPEARALLRGVKTIAVVGLSGDPAKASHRIARFLITLGYTVIPINPNLDAFQGQQAYASLAAYGKPVDVVNIFRKPEAIPEIVEEAIRLGCRVIWMQENISHDQAAQTAEAAGLKVVQNLCIRQVLLHESAG